MRKHGSLKCLLGLALLTTCTALSSARGQALPTAKGWGSHLDVGGGVSLFQQDYGKRQIEGTTFYADYFPHWRYGLTAEARFLNRNTSQQVTMRTYMGGLKVALRPHPAMLQPYAKMVVGTGHIVLPFKYAQGNFLTYAPGAGLDVALTDYVKLRVIDYEYQRWPDFPYGTLSPSGFTTGITIRLTRLRRFPDGSTPRSAR